MTAILLGRYSDLRPIVDCRVIAAGGFTTTNEGGYPYVALVDTGCTEAMLTQEVVAALRLTPEGHGHSFTAGGTVFAPYYKIDFAFDMQMFDGRLLRYKIENTKAFVLPSSDHHQIAIGMGVLKAFTLSFPPDFNAFFLRYTGPTA